jgi:hypothetical protein
VIRAGKNKRLWAPALSRDISHRSTQRDRTIFR